MSKLLRTFTTALLALSTLATINIQSSIAATTCGLSSEIQKDAPAVWFKFDDAGIPTNSGSASFASTLKGSAPTTGVDSSCSKAHTFGSMVGRYTSTSSLTPGTFDDKSFTVEAVIKTPRQTTTTYPAYFNITNSPAPGDAVTNSSMILRVRTDAANAGKVEVAIFSPSEIAFYSRGIVDDGNWHHITVTMGGGRLKLFIDGVLDTDRDAPITALKLDSIPKYIGGYFTDDSTFSGSMDEFAIYNQEFTSTDVSRHFNAFKTLTSTDAAPAAPVAPVAPTAPVVLEPTSTSNGTITTYKFPATMDGGTLGCGRGQIGANEIFMRLEYGGPQWRGDQCYDLFYVFYGDYRNTLRNYTANQLISARQVFTWNSGTMVAPKSVLSGLVNSQWSEGTIIYNSAPSFGSFYESSLSSIDALTAGSSFSVNSIDGVKEHFNGTSNYGFTLRRSSGTATREEGIGEGAPRIHTRDATTPAYRPYLEVIIDSSRPTYPAPIDPPSGLTLSSIAGGINLAWSSTPANTDQVVVEFTCSVSGASRTSVTASSRQATRSSLQAGERCTARAQSSNSGGTSPFSMSTNESIVQGTAPNAGPSLSISASGSTVTTSLLSIPTGATEFTITLSCSQSGQKVATFDSSRTSNTFMGLTVGENCSAFATSKNQWGNSSPGPVTNSVILQGNAPSSISFVAESIQPLQLKISWNMVPTGVTSVDATISCTKSGLLKRSSSPAAMSILVTGLVGGETCSPSVATSNQFGSSAASSVGEIKISTTRLDPPTITTVDVSVPTKATVRWTSPSGAENIEFILKCPDMSDYTFSSSTQYSGRTITGGEGGTTCTVVARAVNSSAASDYSSAYSFTFRGSAPTSAPQGVSIIAGLKNVIVQWDSVPNATQVIIDLICSKTGRQNLTASASTKSISFNASPGDSCYATLAAANPWGTSSNKSNTKSVSLTGGAADSKVTTQAPAKKAPSKAPKKTVTPSKAKTSLICIKGTQQQTITAVSPKCPTGWFKKPTITKQ